VVTIGLALLIAAASVWAFMGIKTELIPDISLPYTTIVTVYPQATPDAVASDVSAPVEKAVMDAWSGKGLKHVTSTSVSNLSVVMAEFEFGTDMNKVSDSLTAALGKLNLPQAVVDYAAQSGGTANPQIIPINMNIMPLISLGVSGNLPADQLKKIVDEQVVPALSQINGVLRVDAEGGDRDQVVILPDATKMNQHAISMAQIAGLLLDHYTSIDEVASTPLASGVTLGDVASISLSPLPSTAITRINGLPSISLSVVKTEDGNTVNVAGDVVTKVAELQAQLGSNVTITTISNQADFIHASISQLEEKAIFGGILAVLVVFFFLWTVRASLITAISIPLSIFFAFLCMRLSGITINIITLSAMTIAVGRLIDDSIVIIEVIYRRMRAGEGFKEASIGGAKEVATPITTATLATIAIFVPLMFIGGIVGEMFLPFGLTVTFAMLASLLVALTLIPALSKLLVSSKAKAVAVVHDNWYQKVYVKSLKWTLAHRITVIVTAIVLLVGSLGLLSKTGTSFMSGSFGEETISIAVSLPPTSDINDTGAVVTEIETLLGKDSGVRTYASSIGTSSSSLTSIMSAANGGGSNTASITVYLKSDTGIEQETANINTACQALGEKATIEVASSSGQGGGMISSSTLSLSIQGANQADIAAVTSQLMEKLKSVAGVTDLTSDLTTVVPQFNIALDQSKLATSGLPPAQIAGLQQEFMLLLYGGTLPGKTVTLDSGDYSIYIKNVTSNIESVEQANSLKIGYPVSVNLSQVADVTLLDTPSHISHTDTVLSATITGTITDKNVGAVNSAIQAVVNDLPAHPGVEIKTAGIAEMMGDTFTRMAIAILVAIVLVFAIVIAMMRSLVNPLIIMASIPFAFIGSILALLITGNTLGVSAMMGLLMLVGIVLTNAIVLVSMVEHLRKSGQSVQDALVEGGKTRLRPIIMTALTTILAMIPMAVLVSSGTVLSAELAIVVIGGMVTSTFLTLFVIPAIYSLVHQRRKKSTV
jgi:HAE1 family hydrophobic/amphiphilic exporter-1